MKRRVMFAVSVLGLVGLLLFASYPSFAMPSYWHVYVSRAQQPAGSWWCWAASLQSIMYYHGPWVNQCQIVSDGWHGWPCYYHMFGYPDDRVLAVLNKYGFHHSLTGVVSFDSLKSELYFANRPIYVRYMYDAVSGHAVVISGYDTGGGQWIERMDPGDGNFHVCSYDWLVHGGACPGSDDGGHTWAATVREIYD